MDQEFDAINPINPNSLYNIYDRYEVFFLISLLGANYYGIIGLLSFNVYMLLFDQARNNDVFRNLICPKTYIKTIDKCYELIGYGMSAVNALVISVFSSIYLLAYYTDTISDDLQFGLKLVYQFSMGYYIADTVCILYLAFSSYRNANTEQPNEQPNEQKSRKRKRSMIISMQDAFFILHHIIVIYYQAFTIDDRNELASTARYYFSYCFLSEYAVLPLNYGWYLINTNQTKNKKYIITGIITIIVYFLSRIVNFPMILYILWLDGLLSYGLLAVPLIAMNYYWFYKLLCKVIR